MFPQSYELPTALLLVLAGSLACFTGYRLFRYVLGIFGFVLGAMISSSMMETSSAAGVVTAALVGGLLGATVLLFGYFIGIAVVGGGAGALSAHFGWAFVGSGDPPVLAVIALAIAGALGSIIIQRHVIVVTTAFVGAWTLILGLLTATGDRGALAARSASSVWILHPTSSPTGRAWLPYVLLVLGLVGTTVQLSVTGKKR